MSSHRGVDRPFRVGKKPKMYVFTKPTGPKTKTAKRFQQCCQHELHVMLAIEKENAPVTEATNQENFMDDIVNGDAIVKMIQSVVPNGIRVEVPTRTFFPKEDIGYDSDLIVFSVVYCGEWKALVRAEADIYRQNAEEEVQKYISLRENKKGKPVSRPFTYPVLDSMV